MTAQSLTVIWIMVFAALLWTCGVFYGFAAALQNISESELEKRAVGGEKRAVRIAALQREPSRYVHAIPLFVTACGASYGCLLIPLVAGTRAGTPGRVLFAAVLIVGLGLLSSLGILTFRRVGTFHPDRFAFRYANYVYRLSRFLSPLTGMVTVAARAAAIPFGVEFNKAAGDVTQEEIISIVDEAHEQGVIEKNEAEMIQNIISFNETQAHDIMTHRKAIVAFEEGALLQEMCDQMLEEGFSRYPVYEGEIDNIVGFVHFKDALKFLTKNQWAKFKPLKELPGLVRKASLVPETRSISDLFHLMQLRKTHIAVVVDEYGQTAGIVSMEDILEEIVGDIMDEYDEEEERFRRQGADVVTINAMTHLQDVEEELGISFGTKDFETLNGYLTAQLGHIPTREDLEKEVEACGYRFRILSLGNRTIGNVRAMRCRQA